MKIYYRRHVYSKRSKLSDESLFLCLSLIAYTKYQTEYILLVLLAELESES